MTLYDDHEVWELLGYEGPSFDRGGYLHRGFDDLDQADQAVIIIGSGAGGGTLAYELSARGIPVVLLEAGPHLLPEDYENDEWAAFNQMAWLDKRTASGSYRLARNFPNLPADRHGRRRLDDPLGRCDAALPRV